MEARVRGRTRYARVAERNTDVVVGPTSLCRRSSELVGNNPYDQNWRSIVISVFVIVAVCGLIGLSIILVMPPVIDVIIGENFTFSDVFDPQYKPRHVVSTWMADTNTFVYQPREGELVAYDVESNATTVIINNSTFRHLNSKTFFVSGDLNYVLLACDVEPLYRHSFDAGYWIYDRFATKLKDQLISFPQGALNEWKDKKLQFAGWSPAGHSLTFVYENNLYYQSSPWTTPTRITTSGKKTIFNGVPDWVYEEEILESNSAHWWSPDGAYICYAQFNDSRVPRYQYPVYRSGTNIYGDIVDIAYPKAGDDGKMVNPVVKLFVIGTRNLAIVQKQLLPPDELAAGDYYFTRVTWKDKKHVMITWTNRPQNKSYTSICDAESTECHVNRIVRSSENWGWVENPKPWFVNEGRHYVTILPQREGASGFWKHIAMISAPFGTEGVSTFLTQGSCDVTEIVGYNSERKLIYYISTNFNPRKRHLFQVSIDHFGGGVRPSRCLTCGAPKECQYVSASFSQRGHYFILKCLGPGVPTFYIRSTLDDREILLENNQDLAEKLTKKAIPTKEYFEIKGDGGHTILAQVYTPVIVNKEHIVRYPMLVHVYAGPGTQTVTEQFQLDYGTYMSSTHNVVYVSIDGRGSGARGDRHLHEVYRRLGTVEVQDQITAGRYLKKHLHFVDRQRIAIWGASYGGYVTAHAVADSDLYQCGVAVAPVTDWRYYDTVYTERYMGLANSNDNFRGYDNANVSRKADQFKGKSIMLIHGTGDDNVHFQHTAHLIKALTEADVDYRIQLYTDSNHEILSSNTDKHAYRTVTNFLTKECWQGGKPREIKEDDNV
ncbi:Dipeptidyl aminopeptidase-like protein 6 [Lamellibrachia satsuma]|nr:Dipeptidyl aminopeptidase-like protein 6 [Lamellibrachia satsuma]